ncbi:MAG: phage terminase large subunit family protein, partial [Planctomycetales bacterium]|nr:phage terminase large subunit family protein [Planctomycetales bacterium]
MPSANLLRWLILLMVSIQSINAAHAEVRWALSASRAPRLRTMRQFGEDEIVLPEGPFAGRRLNTRRQPFTGLLLDAIDSRQWRRHAITGCVQSGKSLHGYVLPALYHLFELKETTILGLPTMDMAKDKWREEILPVIERSRYRHLLPDSGAGSRGGTVEAIKFKHGPTLKFMSGHGGDEKRSSFTARVVVVTEADKMDTAGEASRETSPLGQIEARTLAYGDQARVYLECTVSIEQGAIWTEYNAGTRSRIACPCPHCGDYVTPDREDLVGWQPAKSAADAKDLASWFCPACGEAIDDDQRVGMNAAGRIHGEPPRTDTLGFRWNAFNNLFWPTGMIAAGEWAAVRSKDPEDAERERRQFV